ncbi:biopolymer transporter ExbD [Rhodovulum sulfidophilum]|uniref:Biopolymer transport protein ExbD/TolR n=1 Tax=Rhodovulum sulfidophilum TaxID=35806 RepID=A0A0D6B542_RHOSU|nr:biopolymer transporter ExbD [Rhodovulum sulfidophilum]MBL3586714.1 biopolymer transporter ExbD [Rhodovulum sulfidophilum]MBL3609605.1 biopolymer transporter ExbD [Rhodovulum sulfidophilum]MCE8458158.1 biopolymer transporter ExbD [Rhodovulum sulfidophilum]BAQ70222.1 biopolymer transport protein ExbD/TolR [Rhodovulum sulfidophilum]
MARPRRRRLSLTPLVDVIFLLLLFFMLSSTFTRFAEVDLVAAGQGGAPAAPDARPLFLQLEPDRLRLNGRELALDGLVEGLDPVEPGQVVLVALRGAVTAQRLTDLLVALRAIPGLGVTVLGAT